VDKERQKQLRYRAKTDLMWLAKEILDYTDLNERVHRPVVEHFFKPRPSVPIADVDDQKGMCLYDPRGHFKTSIMQASAIQWMLNYPNIRIFFVAGKIDRASDSLMSVKRQFQHNPKLRALFPEFCPPPQVDWGTTTEFTLPNRTDQKLVDGSLVAYSMDSIKAGPHCDVMFIDDAVHADNVGTPEQLLNTQDRFVFMRSIVEPYGYMHVIGTPYSDGDLYAWLEDDENGGWLRKFRRPVWKIINPAYDPEQRKLLASDVEILFHERFTFEFLKSLRYASGKEYIFNCQYLLDPTPLDSANFTDDLLERHRIPHLHIPRAGAVFQTWDIGFTEKKRNDWSVGATGLFDSKGNLFVLDVVLGRFSPYQIIQQIAAAALKWRPRRIGIEDAGGTKLMLPSLDVIQRQLQRNFNIEWMPTSPFKRKPERILSMQPLLVQDKLYYSAAIPADIWTEVKKQHTKFPRYPHDDAPDAISMLLQFRGRIDILPDSEPDDEFAHALTSVEYDPNDLSPLGAGLVG
jgi:predicted phage terminase large subunit-like protein